MANIQGSNVTYVDRYNGKVYRFFPGPASYAQAKARCSALGTSPASHPVVYNSYSEQMRVEAFFTDMSVSLGEYWLGLELTGPW